MSIIDKLATLSAHFKYYAAIALAEDGPPEKVRAEMEKHGWHFVPSTATDIGHNMMTRATASGYIPSGSKMRIFTPLGKEVYTKKSNKPLEKLYKDLVRQTAAQVYGIKP